MSLNQFPRRSFVGSSTLQTFTGNGSTTTFTLSSTQTQNECFVFVDDVIQVPGTDFTVNGTTLTFTIAPANSSEIIVRGFGVPAPVTTVSDGSVTTAKVADGAITHSKLHTTAIQDKLGYTPANESTVNSQINSALVNPIFTGQTITIPAGTTAQRPVTPSNGMLRYNTDIGLVEQYNSSGWQGIDAPPVVTSYSGTINADTNSTITINGSNFKSGCVVYIEGNGVNNVSRSLTTTFVGSSQLTALTNATSVNYVGGESFNIKVVNPSGLSSSLSPAGTIDRDPVWSTGAGNIATINDRHGSYSPIVTLSASDPDGSAITYGLASGSLPNNVSLNTSNGQISGDPEDVTNATTYTFSVNASSNSQTIARTFNIIINPSMDGSSTARAASNPSQIRSYGITTSGLYYINTGNLGVQQVYCVFDTFNGGSISGQSAWALISRFNSYNYPDYNTYGYLNAINTTSFGTRSQTGFWVNPSVGGRGWLNTANSNSYVCYNDTTTGYYVTEATSGTFWQTSFIHTTSSGYPSNTMVGVNYNSYNGSNSVGACWCESNGCTEHMDAAGNCTSTDIVRFDNHSGNSTVEIWIKG